MKKSLLLFCLFAMTAFLFSNVTSVSKRKAPLQHTLITSNERFEKPAIATEAPEEWYKSAIDQLQKREYQIKSIGQRVSFATANSKQHLGFLFTPQGYSVKNIKSDEKESSWQMNFQFINISRESSVANSLLVDTRQSENELNYKFADYTIQYVNSTRGMRQNFIVNKPLAGHSNLKVNMLLSGDLKAKLENNGKLTLHDSEAMRMIYDEISVWDANEKILPAHLELKDNDLAIIVNDQDAVYPITIDPLNHTPDWTTSGAGLVFSALDDLSTPLLYGYSVSGAGDVNGDGFSDVIIGTPTYVDIISISGGTFNPVSVGAAFVYFGSASGLSATPNEVLQPTHVAGALFGYSVSSAGDVNGDGKSDVVIGAPGDKISLTVSLAAASVAVGKVYVYQGNQFDGNINTAPSVSAAVSLKQADFGTLATTPANPLYGFSVSNAGDVNGDGKSDIVVGAPAYTDLLSLALAGRADVYTGSGTGIGVSPSSTITGTLLSGLFGYSVSTAGKVNNDSFDDIIIGAPASANITAVGAAYVFHGSASGITATSSSAANTLLRAPGLLTKTLFGYSVSMAGDMNSDGRADVIVGEPLALDLFSSSLVAVGRAQIFYGSNAGVVNAGSTQLTSPRKPSVIGSITGNLLFGFSVSGVKDMNCDGIDDVIIGEPGGTAMSLGTGLIGVVSSNELSGQVYVYYGKASTGPVDIAGYSYFHTGGSLSAANLLGYSVKGAGDINGDGVNDLVMGAPNGTLNLASSLTGIIGNSLSYITTNSIGSSYAYNGCLNMAPVAVDNVASTNEDTPITFSVTANDTDDGSINAATVDLNPGVAGIQNTFSNAAGSWSVNAAGNLTYTPTLNFNGSAAITYTVKDNLGAISNSANVTVTVIAVNDAPVAVNDNTITSEDTPVTFSVTANDTDVDGTINAASVDLDPATVGIQNSFANAQGTFAVDALGNVTFTPVLNFNGTASTTYVVNDNSGATSNAATISITVTPVNDAPVAVNDNTTTNEDTPITFSVTANDTDVDGTINAASVDLDPATAGIQNSFANAQGTFAVDALGNVTFTPVLNFNGAASVTYAVNDNSGATSNTATISITVTPVNDAPVAVNDNATGGENTPVMVNVISNDTDVDGTIDAAAVDLNIALAGIQNSITSADGTWTVDASGNVTFVSILNFTGTATQTYFVKDNLGAVSNSGTISLVITAIAPVNNPPVAVNDSDNTDQGQALSLAIVANDTDSDGTINPSSVDLDPATAGIQNTFSNASGVWTVTASGILTLIPNALFFGTASITYQVNDNGGATSNTATISIAVNALPVAVNDSPTTNEDTPITFNVTTNDSDAGGAIDASTVDLDPATAGIQNSFANAQGTFAVNTSGNITFTPVLNFNGTASATYVVSDNSGAISNVAIISITVTSVNDAPVAVNDNTTTNEDTPVTFSVITNDTDVDGTINAASVDLDPATAGIQNSFANAQGAFAVDASGNVTFTPVLNFNGTASISYVVNDNSGTPSSVSTISIVVNATNDAPVAINDSPVTNEDTPLTFNVTSNDTDVDGTINAATVDLDTSTAGIQNTITTPQGTFSADASGNITFTPALNYNGPASVTYTVNDNSGATSAAATATVTINAVDDAPVAVNDSPATNEDTPFTFNVTSNDTDVDDAINTATVDLDPGTLGIQNTITTPQGTFSVDALGSVTFTPAPNYAGIVSITYTVNDNSGATSNAATVNLTVNAVNDVPVAANDNATGGKDIAVTLNVTSNDTDVDGTVDASTVDLDTTLAGIQNSITTPDGTWTVDAAGNVTFTSILNFTGTAIAAYTVKDNSGAVSNSGTIALVISNVAPPNDSPIAVNDSGNINQGQPLTVTIIANDTDSDGTITPSTVDLDPLTAGLQISFSNAAGLWTVNASGNLTLTPAALFYGAASVTYQVDDNGGATSNIATVSIAVNALPVAGNDVAATNENVSTTIDPTLNDTDPDGLINPATIDLDPASAGIQNSLTTAGGAWSVAATGVITFTPALNFSGNTSITYTVNDNRGAPSIPATIGLTVNLVNIAPVANNDNISTNEGVQVSLNVVANDADADGTIDVATVDLDPSTAGIQNSFATPAGGWSVNATGNLTYTPASGFSGTASVTYAVNDNTGTVSNVATIGVAVIHVNTPPMAVNDNALTNENVLVAVSILSNDSDTDGTIDVASVDLDPATGGIQNSFSTAAGSWTVSTSGVVSFSPQLNFFGAASATYTVNDNNGADSNPATISINVNKVNTSPVAVDDNATTNENSATSFSVVLNDTDQDGSIALFTVDLDVITPGIQNALTTLNGSWAVDANGVVTFTPNLNFTGTATLSYTINDNSGATSNTSTISVTVNPLTAPVAVNDAIATTPATPVTFNVLSNDTDAAGAINPASVDLDPATAGIQNSMTTVSGTFTVDASGNVTFTPAPSFLGVATATYTVNDTNGQISNTAVISVNVKALNGSPVAKSDVNSVKEDKVLIATGNLLINDSDPDLNVLSVSLVNGIAPGTIQLVYGTLTVTANGDYQYVLNNTASNVQRLKSNQSVIETISYEADDKNGGTVTSTLTITIFGTADADLRIAMKISDGPYYIGSEVIYTITIENLGEDDATGVWIDEQLPLAVQYQASETSDGGFDPASQRWEIGDLPFGKSTSLTVHTTIVLLGDIQNKVVITGNELDPVMVNNESTVEFEGIESPVTVPLGFSPNGDGRDDTWILKNIDQYPMNSITVFNRWGNEVFKCSGYTDEKSWRGESSGQFTTGAGYVPDGTYFYVLSLGNGDKPRGGYVIVKH